GCRRNEARKTRLWVRRLGRRRPSRSRRTTKNSGSWAKIGKDLDAQECAQEVRRCLPDVVCPFTQGNVLVQRPLVDTPKRPQEVAHPRPESFPGVVRNFADAIAILIPGPLPLSRCVAHRNPAPPERRPAVGAAPFIRLHP